MLSLLTMLKPNSDGAGEAQTATQVMSDALAHGIGIRLGDQRIDPAIFHRGYDDEMRTVDRMKQVAEAMRDDPRFRALVDSTVAIVRADFGRVDPERADRDAEEIAFRVGALILARIYTQDAELRATREERDGYKALAQNAFAASPVLKFFTPVADGSVGV